MRQPALEIYRNCVQILFYFERDLAVIVSSFARGSRVEILSMVLLEIESASKPVG
jgi:hypothetical protein